MKKLTLLLLAICLCFSFCKKSTNNVATSPPAASGGGGTQPSLFIPYTDTFHGVCFAGIGDGGYTDTSVRLGDIYVIHRTDTTITVTGQIIEVSSYSGSAGTAQFRDASMYFDFRIKPSGLYQFNTENVVTTYHAIHIMPDSISIDAETVNCLIITGQRFNGRRRH